MGCSLKKPEGINESIIQINLPLTLSISRSTELIEGRPNTKRRLSSQILKEKDFWGTIPFYVLNNRMRLLSFEVNDREKLHKIYDSLLDILEILIESPDNQDLSDQLIDIKRYKWIYKYENGYKVLRAIGLKIEKKHIRVMEGLTKENLRKKFKEVKYAFSILDENSITELNLSKAFTIN